MRVTVILPCYNNRGTLNGALESYRQQCYPNTELAIVDDGSTDGTGQLIDMFIAQNEELPVHVFKLEQRFGDATAKNLAVKTVWDSTDLFVFLRPTSKLFRHSLEKFVATASTSDRIGLLYGDELRGRRRVFKPPFSPEAISLENIIGGDYALTKRGASVSGAFDEELKYHEDYDMALRVSSQAVAIHIPYSLTSSSLESEVVDDESEYYRRKVLTKHGT